jgi:uncharacterized protein YgbK (DUF1537 family)
MHWKALSDMSMTEVSHNLTDLLATLPEPWQASLLADIRKQVARDGRKIVVLDDDPTGTQTVYDLPVLTRWDVPTLTQELHADNPACFILTNSRSLNRADAKALLAELTTNLQQASQKANRPTTIISRSDSTLRGHFPLETDILSAYLETSSGHPPDGVLLVPYFLEGGRFTIHNTHYIADGDTLTPASASPFAQDATFGYSTSYLPDWVAEKTAGHIPAREVMTLSLETIRQGGPKAVCAQLQQCQNGQVCVVNAVTLRDLEVMVMGQLLAEAAGKQFLLRSAASYVQVRLGLETRPLLAKDTLKTTNITTNTTTTTTNTKTNINAGGLLVVGSYVPTTTAQLAILLEHSNICPVELDVPAFLDCGEPEHMLSQLAKDVDHHLAQGLDVVLFTSRDLITGEGAEASLELGRRGSRSLVSIVRQLTATPRFVIAKGGITSSDIATQALHVTKATVQGQLLPGVPVWQLGRESRFPGLSYVVFPGNVGDSRALHEAINRLA